MTQGPLLLLPFGDLSYCYPESIYDVYFSRLGKTESSKLPYFCRRGQNSLKMMGRHNQGGYCRSRSYLNHLRGYPQSHRWRRGFVCYSATCFLHVGLYLSFSKHQYATRFKCRRALFSGRVWLRRSSSWAGAAEGQGNAMGFLSFDQVVSNFILI